MANNPCLEALFGSATAETFLGLPKREDISQLNADIAIIGAPL